MRHNMRSHHFVAALALLVMLLALSPLPVRPAQADNLLAPVTSAPGASIGTNEIDTESRSAEFERVELYDGLDAREYLPLVAQAWWNADTDADGDGYPVSQDCDDSDDTVYPGAAEVCDGKDNDCDGVLDDGCGCIPGNTQACYPGPAGTEGTGQCAAGTQTCDSQGQWGSCFDAVVPTAEVCDGLDNDCDGQTDEGCP